MTLRQQVMSALGWAAGMRLAGQLLTWGMTLVVVRILAPEDYGLMAITGAFLGLFQGLSQLGLGEAIVQRKSVDDEAMGRIFGLILSSNLVMLVLLSLAAYPIAAFYSDRRLVALVQVASLNFGLLAFMAIPQARLTKALAFRQISWIEFATSLLGSTIVFLLAHFGAGVWSLMVGMIVANTARTVGLSICAPYLPRPRFGFVGLKGIISFGVLRTVEHLAWLTYTAADTFIVGRFVGQQALGLYSVAQSIALMPLSKIGAIISQISFPAFALVQEEQQLASSYLVKALRLLAICGFPVFLGLSSVAPEFVPVVLGPKWAESTIPLQLLAAIAPLRLFNPVVTSFLRAVGHLQISVRNTLFGLVMLPAAIAVGCHWGIVGASLAWLLTYPVFFGHVIVRTCRVVGLPLSHVIKAIGNPGVGAAVMYLVVYASRQAISDHVRAPVALGILIALGAATYAVYCMAFNRAAIAELWSLIRSR
jgi:O-antigen/teichoic acid export membrane protein